METVIIPSLSLQGAFENSPKELCQCKYEHVKVWVLQLLCLWRVKDLSKVITGNDITQVHANDMQLDSSDIFV